MKRLLGAAMVVTLILSVAPVLAGDTFHALSRLPAAEPLDEAQLATVEGGYGDNCLLCANAAFISQLNVGEMFNVLVIQDDVEFEQENEAEVEQEIN